MTLKEIKEYAQVSCDILKFVINRAESFRRIDFPILSALFQKGYLFDIKVIHQYKKPPARIYSSVKVVNGADALHQTIRVTGRWIVEHRLIDKVCESFFDDPSITTVLYDDFAGKPEETSKAILEWLDLDSSGSGQIEKSFQNEDHHNISGNKAKFESRGIIFDQKWKENLSSLKKCL